MAHAPENTLEAFSLALRLGANGLESDAWTTSDGHVVLDHDGVVRKMARNRPISTLRLSELPSHIPTLDALFEKCGTNFELSIDIKDDGTVTIASTSAEGMAEAKARIEGITAEAEVGKIYEGPVVKLLEFGALVNILPGKDGLLHISEISNERVKEVKDYLQEGQVVRVKLLAADERGRLRLSLKAAMAEEGGTISPLAGASESVAEVVPASDETA